jgi:hypothetical protein
MTDYPVIEHGARPEGRVRRWIGANRLRIAIVIGAVEIAAIIFTDFTKWAAFLIAGGIFATYVFYGRNARSWTLRQTTWILAASQLLPVLFAVLAFFLTAIVVVGIVALLAVVVFMLFLDRR